jgi:MazG family protein
MRPPPEFKLVRIKCLMMVASAFVLPQEFNVPESKRFREPEHLLFSTSLRQSDICRYHTPMSATFKDLVDLMARLRSENGCPWDREQTYQTLAPFLLEEAYESFDAVEKARAGEPEELRDELGDLLFQIVFYAQVAKERGEFSIDDVTNAIHTKMVRRHPHVFGDVEASTSGEVLRNWDAIKAEERKAKSGPKPPDDASILDDVSFKTPALMEAHQLSRKAASVGFDWERVEDVFDKLQEEITELRDAMTQHLESSSESDHALVREEIGDLLFAVTNIARHLKVEPEAALKLTNAKFRRRFQHIERRLKENNENFSESSLDRLEELWQEAKKSRG